MATRSEVSTFLRDFKAAMDNGGVNIWRTQKNNDFLIDAGFTNDDVEKVIYALDVQNYSSGPEPDDNPQRPLGDVWKFSREYEGFPMYIKLKFWHGVPFAECMSFHEEDGPMRTPHRRQR